MLLQSLKTFVERKETYAQKLASYRNYKELDKNDCERIVDILCEFLMDLECTDDVAECFPQLLPALVSASISIDKVSFNDGDGLHKLNSVILGKLGSKNRDLLTFILQYFDTNPAPFESIEDDYKPSLKRHNRRKITTFPEVSDHDLVTACYNILCSAPIHFIYTWNWSKFYKYLTFSDEYVRWMAMNCIAVVLGLSESCYLSHMNDFLSKNQQFSIKCKEVSQNNITSAETEELDQLFNGLSSVISIGGVLLPVFKKLKHKNKLNLVSVPSTRRNLQNLAFAVSSNKCVCLQGAVGSGKTALVEFLAQATGHDTQNFAKVQLGDQTDSKMLLGMYRCTDIPGEFLWQPGILTEAVLSGKWLLLEDIDCAPTDVISIIGHLMESKTLSVPGYRDCVHVKSGFQLFVTMRLASGGGQKPLKVSIPFQKDWSCVNVESLSKDELVTIVQTLFPVLHTVATKMIDVFLLFSVGNHKDDIVNSVRNARQISTRDLIKWCSRAVVDFNVSSPVSALKIFQDALDVFCYSVPNCVQRLNLAISVAHKLGIVKTKAEYFCEMHKPSLNLYKESLMVGRAKLEIKKSERVQMQPKSSNFSYTRTSVCLLERIASCVMQKEPVLLVGETGTGKTSCIQYLAQITGHKLIVINMNQQSESTDLLGGYKPVDFKLFVFPIREEFEILFRSYFAIEPNQKFLSHIGHCFEQRRWKTLTSLMIQSTSAALKRLRTNSRNRDAVELLKKWEKIAQKLEKLQTQVQSQYSLAFSFVEGGLVKALKNGDWVLLDEINLATAETLECLSGLLEGSCGSLSLIERGDKEPIKRHSDFVIFACMNPATDVGKKDLPVGLRNRFTEFFVDEISEKSDLQLLTSSYLKDLNLPPEKIESIVKFYLNIKKEAETNLLDGTGHKPHYSLRTLCRALSISAQNPCGNVLRSLYEAFCLSFLTQLDSNSYPLVQRMIVKAILGDKTASAILGTPIPRPHNVFTEHFTSFEGYWILKGDLKPQIPENYVLTETVKQNLKDLVRVVSIGKMPVLLQGDTSVGKTSLITYLAKASGHICVRINNHEHTDLQEYVGTYVADSTGKLVFKEGILVDAMRKGYWIILDELNLAPSDVLEALNRVLDDNRELYIPETQQLVKAHDSFMLFATQNPPGLYGGRKVLSRAFRNRFVELHFDEIPPKELQIILHKRCKMPETYCKQVINVMTELQVRRKSTATFAGKKGFITLRDLFRWAERYHLAPETKGTLYDWSQHLADEGYLVLSSKVRHPEECSEIIQVLKKHLKRNVDPNSLFSLSEKTSPVTKPILESLLSKKVTGFEHVVWTYQMRKMAVLLTKAYDFKEPVLLIGETGGGKTTVCQLLSVIKQQELSIVNCHMHTEASDFLGSLRPVREHKESQKLFEWVDGPLVKAMKNGGFFVVDEISLADDSVLERLNSLLEPERKLLIAEKPSTEENATITANKDFIFVGTMNPGGDYGKKELSPALRNRFTEIWCEGSVSLDDLRSIMVHNLRDKFKESVSTAIIEFLKWLQRTEIGKKLIVSVRDVLTWVNFVNCCQGLEIGDAFFHGAALSYIDGLGAGLTATENSKKFKHFKDSALRFIEYQVQNTLKSKLLLNCEKSDVEYYEDKFGMPPFYVKKGDEQIPDDLGFTFKSPMTRINSLKILRALQLKKPIILEGSPGVGKTSLVSALARASGHRLLRLNLSDQTDISDLFGADLPVEGGKLGEFSWRDGPFLRALKNGDWILLDELNLASQSVLEGLNACLDHRGEIFIPELGMTFVVKAGTRLFGCQNPLRQGGARRGLPKSFLNRFTQVFVDIFKQDDLKFILKAQFPKLPEELLNKMIMFNEKLSSEVGITWAHSGSPWEMNLRDVTRWCEITMEAFERNSSKTFNPGKGAQLLYVDRMRTKEDKVKVIEIYDTIFSLNDYPLPDQKFPIHLTKEKVFLGDEILDRSDSAVYENDDLLLLREQKTTLKGLAQCVNMNWMAILIGESGSGKSSLVRLLANLAGQKLKSVVVHSAMDTTEILGGFEQTDYDRHFEELLERTETLLIRILRKKLKKENLDQVAYLHGLLENVRHLSKDDGKTTGATLLTETKLFLRKTEELSRLVSAMKTLEVSCQSELQEIEEKLTDLSIAVEKDKCLNAGGKFEWVDSVLVKCLQNGNWLLLDQVNLCSPAILDRLNGLLEPNGALTIGEKGVDEQGNVFTVKAHKNFRLFLTMNPRYGEISRAMRNRGVEISILTPKSGLCCNILDTRSLLNKCGIKKLGHQNLLLKIYESLYNDQPRLNEILQVASFTSQQVAKGFTFERSLRNSCQEICGMLEPRWRKEALRKVDEILSENPEKTGIFCYDLNTITLRSSDLRKNSRLAMIEQQGFLLKSSVEMLRNNSEKIDLQDLFVDSPITETMVFLKLLLLDFYERSSMDDLEIRRAWSSHILSNSGFNNLEKISESLNREIKNLEFLFKNNFASEIPLSFVEPSTVYNNLAIALYLRSIIFDCQSQKDYQKNEDVIHLKEYSTAVCSGRLSSNLKNEPLIVKFAELIEQSAKIIDAVLHEEHLLMNDKEYIELRDCLKWFQRFHELGSIELIDKSRGTFFDLREISSSLKVHYKWLTKLFKTLFTLLDRNSCSPEMQSELARFSEKFLNMLTNANKFRKIRKKIKKLLSIPSPHFSEDSMIYHEKLSTILKKCEITDEDLVDHSKTRLKIASLGLKDNLAIREKLINICAKDFKDNGASGDWTDKLMELEELSTKIVVLKEMNDNRDGFNDNLTDIEIWPIYEFFFLLFTYRFQRKYCEQFSNDFVQEIREKFHEHFSSEVCQDLPEGSLMVLNESSNNVSGTINKKFDKIYEESIFKKFEDIPTIPTHLIGLMKTLNSDDTSPKRRILLFPELLSSAEEFSEQSFTVKNSDILLHWHNHEEVQIEDCSSNTETNFIDKSSLCKLIFKMFLTKSGSEGQTINLGNYQTKKKLLKTVQSLLWRNSSILNSKEFNLSRNDAILLEFCINYYMSAVTRVIDTFSMKLNKEEQDDLKKRLLEPMKSLREVEEKLKIEDTAMERGKGWLILGYLQIFLYHDIGSIDPVQKIALKSKYIRENVSELKCLMCVESLQANILDASASRDRILSREDHLKRSLIEAKNFENFQAVRPSSSFQNLREEIENFSNNIGSFESIFRQIHHLNNVVEQIQRKGTLNSDRETLQEATIWKNSLRRFSGKLAKYYLTGFPDLVTPMISAIWNLHHGLSILMQLISNAQHQSLSTNVYYDLLRFPVIGSCQENYLNLAKLCASENLILSLVKQFGSMSVQKYRLEMAKIALQELENFTSFAGTSLQSLWNELNKIFLKIRILWREQEKQREKETQEKQSLFRTKSEKEEDESDYKETFPGFQQDFLELGEIFPSFQQEFPEFQKISTNVSNTGERFVELVSLKDARKIQEIHWNILKNSERGQWNPSALESLKNRSGKFGNSLENSDVYHEANFVEPLARRFEILGFFTETLPENLSSRLVCSLTVLIAQKSNFENKAGKRNVYDFYRDPNIVEVEECQPLIERLSEKIDGFLMEWSENPILNSIKLIIQRLLSFPIDSSLLRFLVGIELLLTKIQQWEENARYDVSLAEFIEFFGKKILHWRKLEISRWKDSLEILEDDLKTEASRWWFFLFDLVDQYLVQETEGVELSREDITNIEQTGYVDRQGNPNKSDSISKEKITENLERFLAESSLIEFEPRLQLIYLFYQHISHLKETKKQKQLSAIFWNIYHYYSQFSTDVGNKIKAAKEPIAKKLKDTIKITRWNDISYWSVKNTAEKTRRTLHKFVKEFRKGVQENVAAYLTLKTRPETLETSIRKDLDSSTFLINLQSGKLNKIKKIAQKAGQFCQNIIVKCNYSQIRKDIEIFIEDTLEESVRLKKLEVDKSLTKGKQQAQLKSILQQKKMALANYFKTLTRLGLSYRFGILTWKNRKYEITNFASTPLDLQEIQKFRFGKSLNDNIDKELIEQWSGCDKYYYESLIKLNFLDGILNSGKSDFGIQNAERCRGFSAHLILLAHRQKETIADFFKHFFPLKIQLLNLTLMMDDATKSTNTSKPPNENDFPELPENLDVLKQRDLQILVQNFQKLLKVLQISTKQIVIFLESYPTEFLEEEKFLDLNESVIPILKENNVVENLLTSMKNSLDSVKIMADELNSWVAISKRIEESGQIFFFHRRHIDFLRVSYQKINEVKQRLIDLGSAFTADHPVTENLNFMIERINESIEYYKATLNPACEESNRSENLEEYRGNLDTLITQILLVIQKKLQSSQKSGEETINSEDIFEENLMTEKLIDSLKKTIPDLRLNKISRIFGELLQTIYRLDTKSANDCMRLLLEHLPLLKQYTLFLHYYLHELVASFRLTCKFLYLQLNVFLDLATNGFCQPEDMTTSEKDQEGDPSQGGMGLADGEGQKDVSDKIESEDQLEDAKCPNEEEEDNEKKDTKEEESGIEMTENFDSHLQDLEQDEEDKDNDDGDDLDKEMGKTDENAEKLDEEIWKDDEENEDEEDDKDKEDQKEEKGNGQETGEEELSAKDGNEDKNEDKDQEPEQGDRRKDEDKKEINEFEEPETNEDQIDPYHGKDQPEIEPEPFDLPDDVDLDDEMKDGNENEDEEDPFDIDKLKQPKMPEETEAEESKEEETQEGEQGHSSDGEDDTEEDDNSERVGDKKKDDENIDFEENKQDNSEKQSMEEEKETEEEKVSPSLDASSKEIDGSKETESRKDGSRDAVENQSNEKNSETTPTDINADDKRDKGTGQSQTEEHQGHSGSRQEENVPTSGEENSSKPMEKRRKPGQSDENRSLLDDEIQPSAKKMKTALMGQELDDHSEEENDPKHSSATETYEHIKNTETFDDFVFDAATEEQVKKQASNLEENCQIDNKPEDDDIEMHEDDPKAEEEKENPVKEHASKVPKTKKEKTTNVNGERSDDIEEIELGGEVEGETVETTRVLRGNESTFHIKSPETESFNTFVDDIAKKRSEIENMLSMWSQRSTSAEAAHAWSSISALTESAARELSEKLRLVLEPTLTSRLKGDYRTGKRINMKKVIPYIASEFRKDKIWLRRTKPSKRDYQIVLAIDDSSSMADSHSKELAFESLSLIGKAMTYLEVGQLAVINFGERVNILHPFGENFTEESGAKLIQEMKFEQKKTMIGQLLDFTIDMFTTQGSYSDNAKLVAILSDGRGIFSEGTEKVNAIVRRAKLLNIFLVFIIVDNPLNKDSILDIRMPVFENGKLLGIRSYLDNFPFPFYIILRDLDSLPVVLSDALRQWFEIVGRIET
ncbi:midasin isoform X2 [Hylaeus anthracinus]|uniref:midasin isoform X2 n=1 Tax=Hylaeus anthracinus TaxID=313031 RepID=UPI0023B93774|nr:midasin isoform X2 [Hylaeus anthracinus]